MLLRGAMMDGFYLAFIGVGFALFWLSLRNQPAPSGVLLTGWILLGASLAIGVVLFAGARGNRSVEQGMSGMIAFEAMRHLLLGGAVVCVGIFMTQPIRTARRLP